MAHTCKRCTRTTEQTTFFRSARGEPLSLCIECMASIWDETTYSVEYDAARDCYVITENGRSITDLFPSFVERKDTTEIAGAITDIRHERYSRWELR